VVFAGGRAGPADEERQGQGHTDRRTIPDGITRDDPRPGSHLPHVKAHLRVLGRSSVKTTEIYKHLAADYRADAMAIVDGLGAEINARSTHRPVAASPNVEGDSQMCDTANTEG